MGDQVKTAAEAVEADALPRVHEVHADPTTPNAATMLSQVASPRYRCKRKAKRNGPMSA